MNIIWWKEKKKIAWQGCWFFLFSCLALVLKEFYTKIDCLKKNIITDWHPHTFLLLYLLVIKILKITGKPAAGISLFYHNMVSSVDKR